MFRVFVSIAAVVAIAASTPAVQPAGKAKSVPIIYSTDLYHPHEDPDDHFDLATLFALPEFDIRAIVVDMGALGKGRPGIPAIRQMMHITGRKAPYATGLIDNLRSLDDRAGKRPATEQAAVRLILRTLRESRTRVTVFCTGSLRDVAAAFNREPDLFRAKVARLYINAGHSGGGAEHNVRLDSHAYVRMLRSGLPVYWVPCFGVDGYESLWQFRHGEVLEAAPPSVQRFFVYALTKASPGERDPIEALEEPVPDEVKQKIWSRDRRMWCTGAFLHAAGRSDPTFSFKKVNARLDDKGVTTIGADGDDGLSLLAFHRGDAAVYAKAMSARLRELLVGISAVE